MNVHNSSRIKQAAFVKLQSDYCIYFLVDARSSRLLVAENIEHLSGPVQKKDNGQSTRMNRTHKNVEFF